MGIKRIKKGWIFSDKWNCLQKEAILYPRQELFIVKPVDGFVAVDMVWVPTKNFFLIKRIAVNLSPYTATVKRYQNIRIEMIDVLQYFRSESVSIPCDKTIRK